MFKLWLFVGWVYGLEIRLSVCELFIWGFLFKKWFGGWD